MSEIECECELHSARTAEPGAENAARDDQGEGVGPHILSEPSVQMGLRMAWWQGWAAGIDHALSEGIISEDNPYEQ